MADSDSCDNEENLVSVCSGDSNNPFIGEPDVENVEPAASKNSKRIPSVQSDIGKTSLRSSPDEIAETKKYKVGAKKPKHIKPSNFENLEKSETYKLASNKSSKIIANFEPISVKNKITQTCESAPKSEREKNKDSEDIETDEHTHKGWEEFSNDEAVSSDDEIVRDKSRSSSFRQNPRGRKTSGSEDLKNSDVEKSAGKNIKKIDNAKPSGGKERTMTKKCKSLKLKANSKKRRALEDLENFGTEESASEDTTNVANEEPGISEDAIVSNESKSVKQGPRCATRRSKSANQKLSCKKLSSPKDPANFENAEPASNSEENFSDSKAVCDEDDILTKRSETERRKSNRNRPSTVKDLDNAEIEKSTCEDTEKIVNSDSKVSRDKSKSKKTESTKQKSGARKHSASESLENSETEDLVSKDTKVVASDEVTSIKNVEAGKIAVSEDSENLKAVNNRDNVVVNVITSVRDVKNGSSSKLSPSNTTNSVKTKTKISKCVKHKSKGKNLFGTEHTTNLETEEVVGEVPEDVVDEEAMSIDDTENDSRPEQVFSQTKNSAKRKNERSKFKKQISEVEKAEDSVNSGSEESATGNGVENVENNKPVSIETAESVPITEQAVNDDPAIINETKSKKSKVVKQKSRGKRSSTLEDPEFSVMKETDTSRVAIENDEPMNSGDAKGGTSSEQALGNDAGSMEETNAAKSRTSKPKSRRKKPPVPEDPENSETEESVRVEPMDVEDAEEDRSLESALCIDAKNKGERNTKKANPMKRKTRGKIFSLPENSENFETEKTLSNEGTMNVENDEPMIIKDTENCIYLKPAPSNDAKNTEKAKSKNSRSTKRTSKDKTSLVENSENSETVEQVGIEDGESDECALRTGTLTLPMASETAKKPKKTKSVKRKSNSKKSPNPRPKKKPKKQRNLDFLMELLEYEDIPLSAKLILQKDEPLEALSAAEIDTLFETLSDTVKAAAELIFENLNNKVALKWLKSVSLLMIYIIESLSSDEPIKESISHMASLLGLLQKLDIDLDVKECITEVCSLLLAKNCELSDQVFFLTMNSIIDFVLLSPPKLQRFKKCIKLLNSLERVIARLQITSKTCEPLVTKFISIAQCKEVLTVKEGRAFVSFLLTLDLKLLPNFHQAIKETLPLPQVKKVHANGYGEAYYLAWLHSAENKEVRKAIETKCFQNYMLAIFTIQRSGLEMSTLGHNVFTILSHLHNKREHLRLSKTVTTLYTPLLWRHLRFENNLIRCNAAEVFFDVYPLEYHGEAKPERIMHLDRQHQEMADLLIDNCHLVRVIALRGVFSCLKSIWTTFPPESLQKLFKIIINDCINDGSSSDVRCTVYKGFTSLLDNCQSHEYLASILPNLNNYLNDECDKVRVAFIKMLQKVKEADIDDLKYWHICDLKLLTHRLAKEKNESVSKALTELLFSNIFSKNNDESLTMKRLIRLILMNATAARKLIQYSSKLLPYKDAYRLMMVILASMRAHVLEKVQQLKDREEAAAEEEDMRPKLKKRRKHYKPLSECTNNVDDDSCHDSSKSSSAESNESNMSVSKTEESTASSQTDKKASPFDEQVVSHCMFDIVCLLWIIHASKLNSPDKTEDLNNLYELSTNMIAMMLKFYKGTETFFGVLQVASLIPLSKVAPVSNIASACISQLKNFGHTLPREECRCIVTSLCGWNRGFDILELVYDWLNEAFKVEDLNFSAFPMNKAAVQRKKKIRFEALEVKPTCSLNLLDMIFSNPVDKQRVLTKNYDQLMELFNYLERIKHLIEKRIKNEEAFSAEFLSDKFLSRCLFTYLKLAIILHKEPERDASSATMIETFSAVEFYSKLLLWCESTLVGSLDSRPQPVICSFINVIIQAGSTMLAINQANKQIMSDILKTLSRCLSCGENGMLVLENAVQYLSLTMNVSLNQYSPKNLRHVYVNTIPHFLECILSAATFRNYDQETILECVEDVTGMKKTMRDVMLNYVSVHAKDKTNSLLPRIINILAKAIVQSFTLEVLKHNIAISTIKLNNLPFFANFLLSLINSRPVFCSIFLTCLNRNVSELYLHSASKLLATISLLFTMAMNKFKFKPAEFSETVKLTNDILMKYRPPPDEQSQLNESSASASSGFIDRAHNLDEQDVQMQGAQLIQQISEKIGLLL